GYARYVARRTFHLCSANSCQSAAGVRRWMSGSDSHDDKILAQSADPTLRNVPISTGCPGSGTTACVWGRRHERYPEQPGLPTDATTFAATAAVALSRPMLRGFRR